MKKFCCSALLILCMILLIPAGVLADGESSLPYYVSDVAGLLSTDEWSGLEEKAEQLSEEYGIGVYLVTLSDYQLYNSSNAGSYWSFSTNFYKEYNLGLGDEKNGILLILSMADRDYSLLAYGSAAHTAFTDYGKNVLENGFLDNFRNDDWYGGFQDYLSGCETLLARAAAGNPVDVPSSSQSGYSSAKDPYALVFIIGISLLVALVICQAMKKSMKPVAEKTQANDYIVMGGFNLTRRRDVFLNRTVTRRVIRTENRDMGGFGGGGGTSIHSGGFSGHSGKF